MCGIAGEVSVDSVNRDAVEKMIAKMEHRGPDASGIWSDEHCVLGHRRLSIIDLSPAGSQPMCEPTRGIVVAFNGEIFNFRDLRESLEKSGHAFEGGSDTEVLLRAYCEWGAGVVERIRGMFAFAVWDPGARTLLLARDRFGRKPLFYAFDGSRFVFASELDALVSGLDNRPVISEDGFASYLRFGYVPGQASVLQGIERLRPGEVLTWKGGKLDRRYCTGALDFPGHPPWSPEVMHSTLRKTLRSAVSDRLVSDVPLGCFLSGGIDSSLVVAVAREIYGPGLKTFTISFPGTARDEGTGAARIAKKLDTDHCQIDIRPSDLEAGYLETLTKCPEPLGDDSFIPTYFISRATREHVTVALSGDGGDELFGGYPKYHQIQFGRMGSFPARMVPEMLRSRLPDQVAKALELIRIPEESARALWLSSLWKDGELATLLRNPASATVGRDFFVEQWEKFRSQSLQERFTRIDLATYLEGSILTKVDRASMAASLEVRSPLLDERILDFSIASGIRSTSLGQGKTILKDLLAEHLPLDLFSGPKKGFGLPIDEWFRGSLRGILEEYTSEKRVRAGGLLDPKAVTKIRTLHLSGRRNYGRKLHALVAWEVWREKSGI